MRIISAIKLLNKSLYLNPKSGVNSLISRCFMRLNALIIGLNDEGINVSDLISPAQQAALTENNPEIDIKAVIALLNRPPCSFDEVVKEMRGKHA